MGLHPCLRIQKRIGHGLVIGGQLRPLLAESGLSPGHDSDWLNDRFGGLRTLVRLRYLGLLIHWPYQKRAARKLANPLIYLVLPRGFEPLLPP